jgi:hypothetical protein
MFLFRIFHSKPVNTDERRRALLFRIFCRKANIFCRTRSGFFRNSLDSCSACIPGESLFYIREYNFCDSLRYIPNCKNARNRDCRNAHKTGNNRANNFSCKRGCIPNNIRDYNFAHTGANKRDRILFRNCRNFCDYSAARNACCRVFPNLSELLFVILKHLTKLIWREIRLFSLLPGERQKRPMLKTM